ncbi:adenosylcobinamide-phosphate synthase CbiB [Pannonibacter indicus]|uniref:Cobalamin biosynthesis protein CobD n=1 Tax=Pannonibacter indicus TaxID=466044 RepID=A0A0K6I9T9_9HYPH|nr:adenosylcobinamide-phosphate synthase CbiB [Pannonibacter indicus]CUA99884.1 adenosylcobinamide-phosphate synthase [Pannonibacter indicus]
MLSDPLALWLLLGAIALDAVIGDPDWLWRRLPHPVVWIGKLINLLDSNLNRESWPAALRRLAGLLTLVLLVAGGTGTGFLLQAGLSALPYGEAGIIVIAAVFLAQNSLYVHVKAVADGLRNGGLAGGRRAVSMIVGRDPEQLDESGVSRAAIESCAENFSDGVVAPVFWFAILGLPGLIAYKAVNTADSMIGHKTARHQDFGWASARFDDLINLPASRLSALFIAFAAPLAGGSPLRSLATVRRDAGLHRSPNAGWPEAAMAGALGVALAGPRVYATYRVEDPFMNPDGSKDAGEADIRRALKVLAGACAIEALLVLIMALALS